MYCLSVTLILCVSASGKLDFDFQGRKAVLDEEDDNARPDQIDNALFPDYGDDYDDYVQKRRRKLFSLVKQETNNTLKNTSDTRLHIDELQRRQGKDSVPRPQPEPQRPAEPLQSVPSQASKHHLHLQQNRTELKLEGRVKKVEQIKRKGKLRSAKKQKLKLAEKAVRPGQTNPPIPADREKLKAKERLVVRSEQLNSKQRNNQTSHKMSHTQIQRLKDSKLQPLERDATLPEKPTVAKQRKSVTREMELQPAATKRPTNPKRYIDRPLVKLNQDDRDTRKHLRDKEIEMNMPLQQDPENSIHRAQMVARDRRDKKWSDTKGEEDQVGEEDEIHNRAVRMRDTRESERDSLWGPGGDFEGADDEDLTPAPVFDTEVNWSQTFQVSHLDLQALRTDWIDLHCNISGNLLLHSSDALPTVKAFMDQLNEKHHG